MLSDESLLGNHKLHGKSVNIFATVDFPGLKAKL